MKAAIKAIQDNNIKVFETSLESIDDINAVLNIFLEFL